ncbi:sporulation transcriptional regulator SpoIIID [Clostridium neonatale]|uniref:Uncharacterized protein n=1 Tax=Clostridium neonatale TaxID=137838 RepID=A0AAD2DE46_9CLOT|nr:sporulation transcriptional regulator SpoIIID [Clostridium neonatale]CAI3201990.1 hypothetical protein CNEO2_2580001 [Clostridium neonatale]CAI3207078.1 hypothetical protein CNEO2_3470001 [Clostridium neonatale]CAI3228666.1 hypothetical protein CNEO2_10120 [Clostridium neonatale]CAI3230227.1 hypothetical protein CNEO2_1950001 [Clostridium neonatale]CAI3234954.1 hypothetical protein CNEO2_2380001 [Clostridium neonatale]
MKGWAKSTIQKDLRDRLYRIDPVLYKEAPKVIETNKAERSMRAGRALARSKFSGGR